MLWRERNNNNNINNKISYDLLNVKINLKELFAEISKERENSWKIKNKNCADNLHVFMVIILLSVIMNEFTVII